MNYDAIMRTGNSRLHCIIRSTFLLSPPMGAVDQLIAHCVATCKTCVEREQVCSQTRVQCFFFFFFFLKQCYMSCYTHELQLVCLMSVFAVIPVENQKARDV